LVPLILFGLSLVFLKFPWEAHAGIALFIGLHFIGVRYEEYRKVPIGWWLGKIFHSKRNLVHVTFRILFGPAFTATGAWLGIHQAYLWLFPIIATLALSAAFEVFEWVNLLLFGEGKGEGPELQGDIWDTHKDILLALAGSLLYLALWAIVTRVAF
jgi:putative membrane protein